MEVYRYVWNVEIRSKNENFILFLVYYYIQII